MDLFLRILKAVFVGMGYLGLLFLAYLVLNFLSTLEKKLKDARSEKEYDDLSFIERHTQGFLVFIGIVSLVLIVSVVYRFSQYFPDDYENELSSMYEEGYSEGFSAGEREHEDDRSKGVQDGWAEAEEYYKGRYDEGYKDGYDNGYSTCQWDHRFDFEDGVSSGYSTGYEDGYSNGYEDAQSGQPYDP